MSSDAAQTVRPTRADAKAQRRAAAKWQSLRVAGLLVGAAGAIALTKLSGLPGSDTLAGWVSFEQLPQELQHRASHLLLAPVGALAVVIARTTLGIRVLGPFRSVLLAIAFAMTGPVIGLTFFSLVIAVVVSARRPLKSLRLPKFARSAFMLSLVASVIVLAMLGGLALGWRSIESVAYFPVVVLTLTGDAFAMTMRREGARSAFWRAAATALVALVICGVGAIPGVRHTLIRSPELILIVLAIIIFASKWAAFRVFEHLNPASARRNKAAAGYATRHQADLGGATHAA